jgi:hypothetical protein
MTLMERNGADESFFRSIGRPAQLDEVTQLRIILAVAGGNMDDLSTRSAPSGINVLRELLALVHVAVSLGKTVRYLPKKSNQNS